MAKLYRCNSDIIWNIINFLNVSILRQYAPTSSKFWNTFFYSKNTFCMTSEAQIVKELETTPGWMQTIKKYIDDNTVTF